jgi:UDP-N-acetylmuramoyl-tripeptide--D-alanyl-D-alanine ligase
MLELGDAADAGHREVGRAAAAVCDLLCVVGPGAEGIAGGAREAGLPAGRLIVAADPAVAAERLVEVLHAGDVVLVKASRGVALEVLVDALVVALGERTAPERTAPERTAPERGR